MVLPYASAFLPMPLSFYFSLKISTFQAFPVFLSWVTKGILDISKVGLIRHHGTGIRDAIVVLKYPSSMWTLIHCSVNDFIFCADAAVLMTFFVLMLNFDYFNSCHYMISDCNTQSITIL